jgi:Cu-Zn family superoxide dismutase
LSHSANKEQVMRMGLLGAVLALGACAAGPHTVAIAAPEAAPVVAPGPQDAPQFGKSVDAPLLNTAGQRIGQARFVQGVRGVLITVEVTPKALSPGWHGLHLHMRGDCTDAGTGFKASGAHLGHGGAQHGLLNPLGAEAGDMPNLFAPDEGPFGAEFFVTGVALAPLARGGAQPLLGPNGAALVIHAARDDHASQPIGNAGARMACAVVSPAN